MATTKKGAKASDETTDEVQLAQTEEAPAEAEEKKPEPEKKKGPHVPAEVTLARSAVLHRVTRTMMNGAASLKPNNSAHPFSAHTGFLALMLTAYNTRNQAEFLRVLEEYLQHAILHVSQAGRREEIPGVMQEIRALMENKEVGFEATALYLLRVVNTPL